jgi:hypothetical protein
MPFLRALNRLPVEGAAEGSAAEEHSAPLLHAVGLGRHAGADPPQALRAAREQAGHEASPTAAIIDSQTNKAAQKGALRLTHRASMLPKSPRPAKVVYRALFGFVLPNSTRCYSYNNPLPHPTGEYGPPP